jgi:hypothetical protein
MSNKITWTAPLGIRAKTCGESNAYWSHPDRTIYLC